MLSKCGRLRCDDFFDRLNYKFSVAILILSIGLVGIRQFIQKPIQCWIPQEFTVAWENYAEENCWTSNTYYGPPDTDLSFPLSIDREAYVGYYQWAPIIMIIQALSFFIPFLLWRLFMSFSALNVQRLFQMASESNLSNGGTNGMNKNVRFMSRYMAACLHPKRDCLGALLYGNYLFFVYFVVKLLYVINIVAQLVIIKYFIGTSYAFYGIQVIYDMAMNRDWQHSKHFLQSVMCDFEAKKLGKNHRYTLQCVLPLNGFLEKIYLFLWFWFVILIILTIVSLFIWLAKMASSDQRVQFIQEYLQGQKNVDKMQCRQFVENYLRPDGVFVIQLISMNYGNILAGDLINELWNIYGNDDDDDDDGDAVGGTTAPMKLTSFTGE